jgi:PEP-CTERM motif
MCKLLSSLCMAAAITFSGAAQAVVLLPNVLTPLPGTTVASDPSLAGTVVQDILTPFTMSTPSGVDTGQVQSRVVLAVDGTYDFYWRVFNNPTSAGPIGFLRTGNILTSSYNANYRIDGLGDLAPQTAFLFASPTPGFINFAFYDVNNPQATQALEPGQSSLFIFLDTNATNFAQTAFLDVATIGTFQASNEISTFGPAPAVPEPATWALMLVGFAGLGFAFRQSRRKVSFA